MPGLVRPEEICDNDENKAIVEQITQKYSDFDLNQSPFLLPQDCDYKAEISVDISSVENFAYFEQETSKLVFQTNRRDVVGTYLVPVSLINQAGTT